MANRAEGTRISVSMGECALQAGADRVWKSLSSRLEKKDLPGVYLDSTGCLGLCSQQVIVTVSRPGEPTVIYAEVNARKAGRIVEEHCAHGRPASDIALAQITAPAVEPFADIADFLTLDFFRLQTPLLSIRCGRLNPESIEAYQASGGYQTLDRVLRTMTPEAARQQFESSGLQGATGQGQQTWAHWAVAVEQAETERYLVCNAQEGDVYSSKDRWLIEGDPYQLLEGIVLAGYLLQARRAYIVLNHSYRVARERLDRAIRRARRHRWLGRQIRDTGFSLDVVVREGPNSYAAGEETMLVSFLEGKSGARQTPPYLTQQGLWGKPTVVTNVETLAHLPHRFAGDRNSGEAERVQTRCLTLAEGFERRGTIEVKLGIPLRDIVEQIGGIGDGQILKALHIGGPVGGLLPATQLDLPLDYETMGAAGIAMGMGSLVALDQRTCMVQWLQNHLRFVSEQSCGQCTPCRDGTVQALGLVERIIQGYGEEQDLYRLGQMASYIQDTSMCSYGWGIPGGMKTALHYFWDEFQQHIVDKLCPAGVCKLTGGG